MYFDEFKHQLPDIDSPETDDWMESLDQVVEQAGETRARFLIYKLLKRARQFLWTAVGFGVWSWLAHRLNDTQLYPTQHTQRPQIIKKAG